MIRVSVLPIAEGHDVGTSLPSVFVDVTLIMNFKADECGSTAHVFKHCHFIRMFVPFSISESCFPVMIRIFGNRIGNLPVCNPSAVIIA